MLKFVRLTLMLLTFIATFSAKGNAAEQVGCGVEAECPAGYYCVGAIGQASSGVCLPNSVNITMCRFLDYVESDILKGLFVFAAVFVGVYMFIGKLTFGTFGQILIGMSILFGATQVITKITGSDDGICTKKNPEDYISQIVGSSSDLSGKEYTKDTIIRNLEDKAKIEPKYQGKDGKTECRILECIKAKCENYSKTEENTKDTNGNNITKTTCSITKGETTVDNVSVKYFDLKTQNDELKAENNRLKAENNKLTAENNKSTLKNDELKAENSKLRNKSTFLKIKNINLEEIKDNDSKIEDNNRQIQYNDSRIKVNDSRIKVNDLMIKENDLKIKDNDSKIKENDLKIEPKECQEGFKVSCKPVSASFERDYFKCINKATNTEFGSEAPSSWNIKSCNDLAKKQIKQGANYEE